MSLLELIASAAGAGLALLVLSDVFLTVLHMDRDGPVARLIVRAVWRGSVELARRVPATGAALRGLAGPAAIASIFAAWIGLYVLAFGLVYWPHLDAFRSESELGSMGLVDAVYFSGNVSSVLGMGDISPLGGGLQILVVTQAAFGFGVFTAGVTYLINVILSASRRSVLTQRLWVESKRTGDGVRSLLSQMEVESAAELHARLHSMALAFYEIEEQFRRLPVIDLLYRSGSRDHPPELMIRSGATLAIAAGVLAEVNESMRGLGVIAGELGATITLLMRNATDEWFGPACLERFDRAEPSASDRRWIAETRARLAAHVPNREGNEHVDRVDDDDPWLTLRSRLRIFMEEAKERMIWTG